MSLGSATAVLIFVRAPELGRVKTRLAAEVGAETALAVYRRLAEHTVHEALAAVPPDHIRIHFTPPDTEPIVRAWLGSGPGYIPQADGDLGQRLETAFAQAFGAGYTRVLVVGSDLPGISAALLRSAVDALGDSDAVLGPAQDGGYWLLGLRRPMPEAFRGVPWSTADTCRHTVARLRAAGVQPLLLTEMTDVDTAADLPPGWF